jgi:hypothetical protein
LASAAIRPFFDSLVGVMCRELPPKIIAENDWTNAANQHGIEFFLKHLTPIISGLNTSHVTHVKRK